MSTETSFGGRFTNKCVFVNVLVVCSYKDFVCFDAVQHCFHVGST
jgi:hypothetical protein